MRRVIEFNLKRSGVHGLPCGLLADWNDCHELGHGGETIFIALQLDYTLGVYGQICAKLDKKDETEWADKQRAILGKNIEQ